LIPHFCFFKKRPHLIQWIDRKYVDWSHGPGAFAVPWLLQPNHLPVWLPSAGLSDEQSVAVQYLLLTLLALLLWDFSMILKEEVLFNITFNFHHLGIFVAIFYGPFLLQSPPTDVDQSTAEHITNLFAWLWLIHALSFFVEVVYPLIMGKKLTKGARSYSIDVVRHGYSVVSAYFMYQYLHAEGQLGLGWNYQTGAFLTMTSGRYLTMNNWKRVDYLRRVEIPLFFIIVIDSLFFLDPYMERTIVAAVVLFATYLLHSVFIKKHRLRPANYNGLDGEVQQLLKEERVRLEKELPGAFSPEMPTNNKTLKWFDGREGWKKDWPVFRACVAKDLKSLARILKEAPTESGKTAKELVNEKMTAYADTTPLCWTAHPYLENIACTLMLLEWGANPYVQAQVGAAPMDTGLGIKHHAVLFEKLDRLALKRWPTDEVPWVKRGVWDRLTTVVGDM